MRYKPWGEDRFTSGTTPTTMRYTGQRQESSLGLYFYNARWYDPALGRFISADTIVPEPGNPQSLNRYSYVLNSPLRYTDPSGHVCDDGLGNAMPGNCGGDSSPDSNVGVCESMPWECAGTSSMPGGADPTLLPDSLPVTTPSTPVVAPSESPGAAQQNRRPIPDWPDYIVGSGSVAIPNPLTQTVLGITVQIIRDRDNNWYWALGPAAGETATGASLNVSAGWLLTLTPPTEKDRESFITKHSVYVNAGNGPGGGVVWGDPSLVRQPEWKDVAFEFGAYTAQVGGSYVYGMWIYDANSATPWFWQR